jgi:hypothetical protein
MRSPVTIPWLVRAGAVVALVLLLQACDDPVVQTFSPEPTAGGPAGSAPPSSGSSPSPSPVSPAETTGVGSSPDGFLDAAARGDWRPAPLPVPAPFLARFEATCVAAEPAISGLPVALRELRGEGHVTVIFGEANVARPSFLCRGSVDATTAAELEVVALDAGRDPIRDEAIDIVRWEAVEDPAGNVRTVLIGRVGRAAVFVRAGFPDESEVDAVKGGGWYAMWWPGAREFIYAAGLNRQSIVIGDVPPPGPPPGP